MVVLPQSSSHLLSFIAFILGVRLSPHLQFLLLQSAASHGLSWPLYPIPLTSNSLCHLDRHLFIHSNSPRGAPAAVHSSHYSRYGDPALNQAARLFSFTGGGRTDREEANMSGNGEFQEEK